MLFAEVSKAEFVWQGRTTEITSVDNKKWPDWIDYWAVNFDD